VCEVKVFKRDREGETLLLKDVYLIEEEAGGLRFETIFGEQKVYEAEVESVLLSENKVIIRDKT
jgi:predicted RNA-binding protein